jgi:hypothetical protein
LTPEIGSVNRLDYIKTGRNLKTHSTGKQAEYIASAHPEEPERYLITAQMAVFVQNPAVRYFGPQAW